MSELTATVEQTGNIPVIRLSGYLSSESAAPLEDAFQQAADAEKVLLVFAEKAFINSAGLAVLFDLILPAKDQGRQFRVVHPAKHFRKVVRHCGDEQGRGGIRGRGPGNSGLVNRLISVVSRSSRKVYSHEMLYSAGLPAGNCDNDLMFAGFLPPSGCRRIDAGAAVLLGAAGADGGVRRCLRRADRSTPEETRAGGVVRTNPRDCGQCLQ